MHISPLKRIAAFTLIELLVVISIIAVLISIMLPALTNSRVQAKKLQNSVNIRGMVQGYTLYATDRKGVLANSHYPLGTDPVWFNISGLFDHTPIFNDYGTMPLTASPLLGTPRFDDPGNSGGSQGLPWYYMPGTGYGGYQCFVPGFETANAIAPLQIEKGRSDTVMLQDQLVCATTNLYYVTLPTDPSRLANPTIYLTTNPSYKFIRVNSLNDVLGCYTGTYDGAVVLRKTADARWSGYGGALTTYVFGHFQPQ